MDKSDNYFYKLEKAQDDVQYLGYLLQTIRSGIYENGRLLVFCTALANSGKTGWMEFIDSVIENPSINTILSNGKKKLGHTFKSIEDVYRTMIMIVENDVFETIIEVINTNDVMLDTVYMYEEDLPITAGKDQTKIYFVTGDVPLDEQRILIRELKKSGYYSQYHMTVTADTISLTF